jgi:hypothetical protein
MTKREHYEQYADNLKLDTRHRGQLEYFIGGILLVLKSGKISCSPRNPPMSDIDRIEIDLSGEPFKVTVGGRQTCLHELCFEPRKSEENDDC